MVLKLLPLLLVGCLKQPGAVQSPTVEPVALAGVLTSVDDGASAPLTEDTLSRLAAVVQARNLSPRSLSAPGLAETISAPLRLERLAAEAGDASAVVLVEASARFFSQMNGQYRWTVDVRLTVAPRGDPSHGSTDGFEVPVFLQFDHEGEPEALSGALPIIERRLGALLDLYLVGRAEGAGSP